MVVSKTACVEVVGTVFCFSACCDLVSWLLVFRTENYKRWSKTVETLAQQLRAEKRRLDEIESKGGKSKGGGKPLEEAKRKVARLSRVLGPAEMRVQLLTVCFHVATLVMLVLTYDDTPVAKLPFTPWRFVTGFTHLGIDGTDHSECGVTFLYALCSMALKQNMGRALGFAPPLSSAGGQKVNFGPFSLDPKGLKGQAAAQ